MSDLEMTKLCAEAMSIESLADGRDSLLTKNGEYDPLHDDAQAMALVKKFRLQCGWYEHGLDDESGDWSAAFYSSSIYAKAHAESSNSLNHAIVECVAKIQAAK